MEKVTFEKATDDGGGGGGGGGDIDTKITKTIGNEEVYW